MTVDQIIDDVFVREGRIYTNDLADHGGPTKYGVTLAAWQEAGHSNATAADIESLTESEARAFYTHRHFWEPKFNLIPDPWIQAFMVDMGVLQGAETAIRILQKIVGAKQDGKLGPITLELVNVCTPESLRKLLIIARMHHLLDCMVVDFTHEQIEDSDLKWRHGWWNRVASFL